MSNDTCLITLHKVGMVGGLQGWDLNGPFGIIHISIGKNWFRGVWHRASDGEIEVISQRRVPRIHLWSQGQVRGFFMSFVKRITGDRSGGRNGVRVHDEVMGAEYPALWEYLNSTMYEDGKRRQTMRLTIFTEDGRVKACLNDPDSGSVAFVSGDTWEGLLRTIEEQLATGVMEWRRSRWQKDGKK